MRREEISYKSTEYVAISILENYLSSELPFYRGGENIYYFDGWDGLGTSAVLAVIAELARSLRSKFDKVMHVDCSMWESRREMQRRIAEELKLDRSVMALFDKQDEDDDFSGIDKSSRAEIPDVADHIFRTLEDHRCLMIFHNGSDHEIDLAAFGVPILDWRNKVLWTFRGRFGLDPTITSKVKSAHVFLSACPPWYLRVAEAVREAKAILEAVRAAMRKTMREAWREAMREAMREALRRASLEAVREAMRDAVREAMRKAMREARNEEAVREAVREVPVLEAVVAEEVSEAVAEEVREAVRKAVREDVVRVREDVVREDVVLAAMPEAVAEEAVREDVVRAAVREAVRAAEEVVREAVALRKVEAVREAMVVVEAEVVAEAEVVRAVSEAVAVREEAAQVSHDINPTIITDCWFYLALPHYFHDNPIDYDHDSHASNYWVCDGIIPGDSAWENGGQLHEAMRLEYLPTKQTHIKWRYLFSNLLRAKKSRWISITSKNTEVQNIQTIPKETTSYFLTLEKSDHLAALPTHLFEHSSKLRVLRLSLCTFSFACPPFICCSNLRFIFIDSCKDEAVELIGKEDDKQDKKWRAIFIESCKDEAVELMENIKWKFLQKLWVLDIRGTSWDWILSPSKMKLMIELRELNLTAAGASRCILDMTKLELTWLCNLRKLRVIDSSTFLTALVKDSFMGMQKLELLDLSRNSAMEVLPNLATADRLKVLILDGCDGLQHVEPDALSTSLESFSFDGFGPASRWKNSLQIPEKEVRPSARDNQELPKISKISLEGCARLKSVFLRGLPNLKELILSETAIKALDLEAMLVRQLERLFLIGCENLRRVQWLNARNPPLKLLWVDTRGKAGGSMDGDCQRSYSYSGQNFAHVVATDARLLQGFRAFARFLLGSNFHFHLSSTVSNRQLPGTTEIEISSSDGLGLVRAVGSSIAYRDVLDKVVEEDNDEDGSMQAHTQLVPSEHHIEVAKGGSNWEFKSGRANMASLMDNAKSMHMHDNSSITALEIKGESQFTNLRWCRVDKCPKLYTVFLADHYYLPTSSFKSLETFWASDLLEARCIWSRYLNFDIQTTPVAFSQLRYIHLHSCLRLTSVLPWSFPTMASLETIHITYCGELRQIFPKGRNYKELATNVEFPRLRNIHLHELPMLQHICETKMSAPMLETIKLRGCWSLRQLPAIHAGRAHDKPSAVVDCEKHWWENLQWDGLEASRHLFSPQHSRYYKKTIPRGSVLR